MKNGTEIEVSKMSTSHIKNTIRLCHRAAESSTFSGDADKWHEWIEVFEDELSDRKNRKSITAVKEASTKVEKRGAKVELTCACGTVYKARVADVKRGWGKSCSKSCAAKKKVKN